MALTIKVTITHSEVTEHRLKTTFNPNLGIPKYRKECVVNHPSKHYLATVSRLLCKQIEAIIVGY